MIPPSRFRCLASASADIEAPQRAWLAEYRENPVILNREVDPSTLRIRGKGEVSRGERHDLGIDILVDKVAVRVDGKLRAEPVTPCAGLDGAASPVPHCRGGVFGSGTRTARLSGDLPAITMKSLLPIWIAVVSLLVSGTSDAQSPVSERSSSLNVLKLEFDIDRVELMKPLKELDGLYREQLDKLRLDAQSRGNLDQVIAVRAELAALEGSVLDEKGEDFPDLAKARAIYGKARGEREAVSNQGLLALIAEQKTRLEALRTTQTQENQLDEAVRTDGALGTLLALEAQVLRGGPRPDARSTASASGPRARHLKVRVQVDGVSHLHVAADGVWFDHTRGNAAPPGRHQGEFPTYLDDAEWLPAWSGKVTRPHPVALDFSFAGTRSEVRLRQSNGRGFAKVVQQPDASNGYVLVVELRDETPEGRVFGGSDWMEFRLSW